jgi:hypothetical protein
MSVKYKILKIISNISKYKLCAIAFVVAGLIILIEFYEHAITGAHLCF